MSESKEKAYRKKVKKIGTFDLKFRSNFDGLMGIGVLFNDKKSLEFIKKVQPVIMIYGGSRVRSLTPKLPKIIENQKKYSPVGSRRFKKLLEKYKRNSEFSSGVN